MDATTLLLFLAGLGLLILGAELLVRGASRLAAAVGVSPLVIGLTIVAYGTSAPELAVSVKAGLAGQTDIAVGNIVGSNIFNVLFILGASALVAPLVISQQLIRWDVPIMIGVSVLAMLLGLDGRIGPVEGLMLLAGLAAYTVLVIRLAKREKNQQVRDEYAKQYAARDQPAGTSKVLHVGYCLAGLVSLVAGTRWFVNGAMTLAAALGVSELVIGLTIVAAGTSMPELFTSIVAAIRGERDIAVGNVVGSCIFNILAILGASALAAPGGLRVSQHLLWVDIPVMIGAAVACLPIFFTGLRISRWEGAVFLGYYAAYVLYLILKSRADGGGDQGALAAFKTAMFFLVMPLTALTLTVTAFRAIRAGGRAATGAAGPPGPAGGQTA